MSSDADMGRRRGAARALGFPSPRRVFLAPSFFRFSWPYLSPRVLVVVCAHALSPERGSDARARRPDTPRRAPHLPPRCPRSVASCSGCPPSLSSPSAVRQPAPLDHDAACQPYGCRGRLRRLMRPETAASPDLVTPRLHPSVRGFPSFLFVLP